MLVDYHSKALLLDFIEALQYFISGALLHDKTTEFSWESNPGVGLGVRHANFYTQQILSWLEYTFGRVINKIVNQILYYAYYLDITWK